MDNTVKELLQVVHRFHAMKPKFQKHGTLANVEFFILMCISVLSENNGEGITIGDMMKGTHMTMSAASKKITILEKKGFIERYVSDKDRRNVYIVLTPKGKEICEEEKAKKHAWMKEVIRRMGKRDAKQMVRLLNKMFDVMEQMELEPDETTRKGE